MELAMQDFHEIKYRWKAIDHGQVSLKRLLQTLRLITYTVLPVNLHNIYKRVLYENTTLH